MQTAKERLRQMADWSNGKVAMTGRSYAGTMPFAVATTGVEGLETIVPIAGIADWYSQQNMQGAQRYWPKEMAEQLPCLLFVPAVTMRDINRGAVGGYGSIPS